MRREAGFTLIEVMVAAAILGIAATALFGLLSKSLFNLQKIEELHHYQLAGEQIMNRVILLSALPPEGRAQGKVEGLSARWVANVTPWIPRTLSGNPADAVMKVDVAIFWTGRAGERNIKLEAVKPAGIAYSNYDFQEAIEKIPN